MATQTDVHGFIEEHSQQYLADLTDALRIPSISTLRSHMTDIARAAQFFANQLRAAKLNAVSLVETNGAPLVTGHWVDDPQRPTILIYGHYDVQPVDPVSEWKTPPFEPSIRNGKIYARGATDNKGQILALVEAIKAMMSVRGRLPVNVKFLIEGEEESGGEAIEKYVNSNYDALRCNCVLVSDTNMLGPGLPAITYGLRGILYTEIRAHAAPQDSHSGMAGGLAPNPLNALINIVAKLTDEQQRIAIPSFYENVGPTPEWEKQLWAKYPIDLVQEFRQAIGTELVGDLSYTPLERVWTRPTLDVHGFSGGFQEEGSAKTAIPSAAQVKVSMRLVPNQTPEAVLANLRKYVAKITPKGVDTKVVNLHGCSPVECDTHSPYVEAARAALSEEYGSEVYFVRMGGSLPIAATFMHKLKVPIVFAGYGLPDENAHAPNEHFELSNYYHAIHATVRFLDRASAITI